jgi:uncharacterized protein (TIGR00645 family)
MAELQSSPGRSSHAERLLERVIFGSRWLLAPFYVGLAASLVVLLVKFAQQAVGLFVHAFGAEGDEITVGILSLIDLSLMGNLLLMVIFGGYESFVSRLNIGGHQERLEWMGRIGFSDLKLKLMASIVAISGIHLLEAFMNAEHLTDRKLGWLLGIHMAFVLSGVLLALMDRVSENDSH